MMPLGVEATRTSHEIDYEVHGADIQFVEVTLDPGEVVIGERGSMLYMDDGIEAKAKLGDGSDPPRGFLRRLWRATFGKLAGAMKRSITKESVFLVHFKNIADKDKRLSVGLTALRPGRIIVLDLAELGGAVVAKKGAFLAAAAGTKVGISLKRKLRASLFGGEGFVMQRLEGDGIAFLHTYGTVIEKELKGGTLLVDTKCLVAMTPSLDYAVRPAGGIPTMALAGEGVFVTKISGHGVVWLQSQPQSLHKDPSDSTSARRRGRRR